MACKEVCVCILAWPQLYELMYICRFDANICYLLARSGCLNIREDEDENVKKIRDLCDYHLNAGNVEGIKRGRNERRNAMIQVLRSRIDSLLIDEIELFVCGDWKLWDDAVDAVHAK